MKFPGVLIPSICALAVLWPSIVLAQDNTVFECTIGEDSPVTSIEMAIEARENYDDKPNGYSDYINLTDCEEDEEWQFRYIVVGAAEEDDIRLFWGSGCEAPFPTDEDCTEATWTENIEDDGDAIFSMNVSDMISDCTGEGEEVLWFVFFEAGGSTDHMAYCTRSFDYDGIPPDPPTITSIGSSDGAATLNWEHAAGSEDRDHDKYYVYSNTLNGATDDCSAGEDLPAGSSYDSLSSYYLTTIESGATTTSSRVGGGELSNDVEYAFSMAAMDLALNIGSSSSPDCATPRPVDDFFSYYVNAGGEAGFCFVATAAYEGNYDHPDVLQLRWFRDTLLRKAPGGRWLIGQYYRYGRDMASALEARPWALSVVRSTLELTTDVMRVGRAGGLWWTLLLAILSVGVCFRRLRGGLS